MVHLKRFLFGRSHYLPLREAGFNQQIEKARELQRGLSHRFTVQLKGVLHLGMELLRCPTPYQGMQEEVFSLMPRSFLLHVPHHRLAALFRYLQRIRVRAERARVNPVKDEEKAKRIAEFDGVWVGYLKACPPTNVVLRRKIDELRWQIEEFKVSIFAQELGTEGTVSAKRLTNLRDEIAAQIN